MTTLPKKILAALTLGAGLIAANTALASGHDEDNGKDRVQQTKPAQPARQAQGDGKKGNDKEETKPAKEAQPGGKRADDKGTHKEGKADGDDLPTIAITSPANNTALPYPAPFKIVATVTFPGKAGEHRDKREGVEVEFLAGAKTFAEAERAPYQATFTPPKPGIYILTAEIRFGEGKRTIISAPITVISEQKQTYYIHTDQLDTPRTITDPKGNVVWQWDNTDPFGNNAPNENPSGKGAFRFPLRFAGQYFDTETNLAYNASRDYEPAIGRYIESDPIGLMGGINTYAYVGANPLRYADPDGLCPCSQGFLDCMVNCLAAYDPINGLEKAAAYLIGGPIPKTWLGLPSIGSPFTSLPSYLGLGNGTAASGANTLRIIGRGGSAAVMTYGLYLFGVELMCGAQCSGDNCAY